MKPPIHIRTKEEMIEIFGQPYYMPEYPQGYQLRVVRVKPPSKAKITASRKVTEKGLRAANFSRKFFR